MGSSAGMIQQARKEAFAHQRPLPGVRVADPNQTALTSPLIAAHGGKVVEESRGASAFVLEMGGQQLAFVVEGLGTKSILARQWLEQTGEDRFADVGIDEPTPETGRATDVRRDASRADRLPSGSSCSV